jgi:hypothetical protein
MDPDTLNRMIREYREVTASTVKRAKKTLMKAGSTAQAMAAIEAKGRHQEPSPESKPRARPYSTYLGLCGVTIKLHHLGAGAGSGGIERT